VSALASQLVEPTGYPDRQASRPRDAPSPPECPLAVARLLCRVSFLLFPRSRVHGMNLKSWLHAAVVGLADEFPRGNGVRVHSLISHR
jgi:hypothetical protein